MVDLNAKSACAGLLPVTIGGVALTEVEVGRMWSVSPFAGAGKACETALEKVGVAWPKVGERNTHAAWFGLDQVMVFADTVPDLPAAVTDQSDAWAVVLVSGDAQAVLARLVPVDLRVPDSTVLRTLVGHMTAHVTCLAQDQFEVMVMRSMTETLVHDLTTAAEALAARGASGGHI
ncbi:MAG: sarcosine oxidase subunit gamma [Yoonia sp.]|nr:sarcosine oxidase subunit gamma [Yoonia sp.]